MIRELYLLSVIRELHLLSVEDQIIRLHDFSPKHLLSQHSNCPSCGAACVLRVITLIHARSARVHGPSLHDPYSKMLLS